MTRQMATFPTLAEPITVPVTKLAAATITEAGLTGADYAVIEPAEERKVSVNPPVDALKEITRAAWVFAARARGSNAPPASKQPTNTPTTTTLMPYFSL